jgi:hypothetical protein
MSPIQLYDSSRVSWFTGENPDIRGIMIACNSLWSCSSGAESDFLLVDLDFFWRASYDVGTGGHCSIGQGVFAGFGNGGVAIGLDVVLLDCSGCTVTSLSISFIMVVIIVSSMRLFLLNTQYHLFVVFCVSESGVTFNNSFRCRKICRASLAQRQWLMYSRI